VSHRQAAEDTVKLREALKQDRAARDEKLKRARGYDERLEILREARAKMKTRQDEATHLIEQEVDRG
jgi:acyl-CoA reductase-like NAD-dependent aldehyde dehydrogenase